MVSIMSLEITKEFLYSEIDNIDSKINELKVSLGELDIKIKSSELIIIDIEKELNSGFSNSVSDQKKVSILKEEKDVLLSYKEKAKIINDELIISQARKEKLSLSINEIESISNLHSVPHETLNNISVSLDVLKDNLNDELESFDNMVSSFFKVDPNRIVIEYRKFKKDLLKSVNDIDNIRNKLVL